MHEVVQSSGSNLHMCGRTGRQFSHATGLIKHMRLNSNSEQGGFMWVAREKVKKDAAEIGFCEEIPGH